MEMTFCSREEAEAALKKAGNVLEALCLLMEAPAPKKERTLRQKFFDDARNALAEIDKKTVDALIASRPSGSAPDETQTPREETSPQNNCSPECQPRAQELVEQKQETDGP